MEANLIFSNYIYKKYILKPIDESRAAKISCCCHTKRRTSGKDPANPSFGVTPTIGLKNLINPLVATIYPTIGKGPETLLVMLYKESTKTWVVSSY